MCIRDSNVGAAVQLHPEGFRNILLGTQEAGGDQQDVAGQFFLGARDLHHIGAAGLGVHLRLQVDDLDGPEVALLIEMCIRDRGC